MHYLTPRFILNQFAQGERFGRIDAAALVVDISGFTAITEALMQHGQEGSEVLADVMLALFEPLLATVYAYGGFIATFGGDAFTALFPQQPPQQATAATRATAAAHAIQQHMAAHPNSKTRYGAFPLTVRAGVGIGTVEWGIVGSDHQKAAYFRGSALASCTQAEAHAPSGAVVLAEGVALDSAETTPIAPGFVRLVALNQLPDRQPPPTVPENVGAAAAFFDPSLLHATVRGEFRDAISVFVNVRDALDHAALNDVIGSLLTLLQRYGGQLCRLDFGDKGCNLLLFWGVPTGSERDVDRAINFVLALLESTPAVTLRVGMTQRMAYAGFVGSPLREEYTCYGLGVNLAARLMMGAPWGAVWLDGALAQRASSFDVRLVGQRSFKGFASEQPVFELLKRLVDSAESPLIFNPLIGRSRELTRLRRALDPLFEARHAGVIMVAGEAGIGKSHLVTALLNQSDVRDDCAIFYCQSDEMLRQSLNPWRYWLMRYFDQATAHTPADRRRHFERELDTLIAVTEDAALQGQLQRRKSFLAALIDLHDDDSRYAHSDAEQRFDMTLNALAALIQAECSLQPVVLVLEDAHWLDADSHQFLQRLMRQSAEWPLALIVTTRTPLSAAWLDVAPARLDVSLGALDETRLAELLRHWLHREPAPALLTFFAARSDGNPFFAHQLWLLVRERGWLAALEQGQVPEALGLSADTRSLLLARLDQLDAAVRDGVQRAAVLGREFELPLWRRLLPPDAPLPPLLAAAAAAGVWERLDQTRYRFHHALMRDAAYDMQLRSRLRDLHGRAALAYEAVDADAAAPRYAAIAYHFDKAERAEPASRSYALAGEQASAGYRNGEAAGHFTRGLALTDDGGLRLRLHLGREAVNHWRGNRAEQRLDLAHARTLADGDDRTQAHIALRWATFCLATADFDAAAEQAQQALALATALADDTLAAQAYHRWARSQWQQGQVQSAEPLLKQALALAGNDSAESAICRYDLGVLAFYGGSYAEARRYLGDATALFERANDQHNVIRCIDLLGLIAYEGEGAYEVALHTFEQALALCRDVGWTDGTAHVLAHMGNAYFEVGDFAHCRTMNEQALRLSQAQGDTKAEAVYRDTIGLTYYFEGEPTLAQAQYERALALHEQMKDRRGKAYLLTHSGLALVALGEWDAAADRLHSARALRQPTAAEPVVVDTDAVLAWLAFCRGEVDSAEKQALAVAAAMTETGMAGIELPLLVAWHCFTILQAGGQSAAAGVLAQANARLTQVVQRIEDDALRQQFQAVPHHRQLAAAWAALSGSV